MIKLYKQRGETPLEALKRLRRQRPELSEKRLSYAGRLDPLASGILPVLVGEENDQRNAYLSADKTYVFTVLFGVATDTFDLLGLPICLDCSDRDGKTTTSLCTVNDTEKAVTRRQLEQVCSRFVGDREMKYPPYSSKTVSLDGKQVPLWQVARAGRIDEVELPTKEVEIHDLYLQKIDRESKNYIISYIINQIEKVSGNFRQEAIMTSWQKAFKGVSDEVKLPTATFKLRCSSGTYVRRLADEMGERLDIPATTFAITRVSTGV